MNQGIKSLYHFEIQTTDDVWHIFATIMSIADSSMTIDFWCPENPMLTQRFTMPLVDSVENYLQQFIKDRLIKNGLSGILMLID